MKPDGIWGGSASYLRVALLLWHRKLPQVLENRPDQENPKREGTEGGRFTRSTGDSGPVKPGNSVEDKTPKTRKVEEKEQGLITENPPFKAVKQTSDHAKLS